MRSMRGSKADYPTKGMNVERDLLEIGGMELRQRLKRPEELARHLHDRLFCLGQPVLRHRPPFVGSTRPKLALDEFDRIASWVS
jgi:hypothetical protein